MKTNRISQLLLAVVLFATMSLGLVATRPVFADCHGTSNPGGCKKSEPPTKDGSLLDPTTIDTIWGIVLVFIR